MLQVISSKEWSLTWQMGLIQSFSFSMTGCLTKAKWSSFSYNLPTHTHAYTHTYTSPIELLYFDLRPGPKMLFQGDTPEGSNTFQWPVIERDRMGGLRWRSHCATTVMHRKRVTSELHDSYFRLITIKHSISKIQWAIVWALNYYLTQLSSGCQSSCQ